MMIIYSLEARMQAMMESLKTNLVLWIVITDVLNLVWNQEYKNVSI